MSTLARYQKSGGFLQLVQLIETCAKQKQDTLLGMVEKEDARWARAVREKMLTIDRIFAWDDNTIAEISSRLHQITLATLLHGIDATQADRMLRTFSHSQRRTIEDLKNSKAPTAAELSSAFIKLITEVRSLNMQGYLRFEKIAPDLMIPEGVEEKIGRSMKLDNGDTPSYSTASDATPEPMVSAPVSPANAGGGSGAESGDAQFLRNKVHTLSKENVELKNELKVLRDKLAQIRRIA